MQIISLISKRGGLDAATVEAVRGAWGGGTLRLLSKSEAVEFGVPERPENLDEVRGQMLALGVDVNCVPTDNRRKTLLLADMDSTMIEQECIDELAEVAGAGPQVREITARAMNAELDFEEALRARVRLLEGLPAGVIDKVLRERITLAPGGLSLVRTMRQNGAYCALVSGGFTAFTRKVAEDLGFDSHRANELIIRGGKLTGDVRDPILGREAKVAALNDLCRSHRMDRAGAICVGDGANDLGMLHAAGMGVALHAKPSVAAQCDLRVSNGDLTALLFLQGYAREEFAA